MKLYSILLFPLTLLYDGITYIRNRIYDRGLRPSVEFDRPVISVGNIEVGGTGKTPMTGWLINYLSKKHKVAMLSRGYKRLTRGFRIIGDEDNANTVGDEPYQLYLRHKQHCVFAVDASRETAIPFILAEEPETEMIILDDAFQYRTIRPQVNILLTRFQRPFYTDWIMPSGRLRERRSEAKRADIILVTKVPGELDDQTKSHIISSIRNYSQAPVFFTAISYGTPQFFLDHPSKDIQEVILVTGVAHTSSLQSYVEENYHLIHHFKFPDHHRYSKSDINSIVDYASQHPDAVILTTEKDAVKWKDNELSRKLVNHPVAFIPIEPQFLGQESEFLNLLDNSLKTTSSSE